MLVILILLFLVVGFILIKQRRKLANADKKVRILDWHFPVLGHLPSLYYNRDSLLDWFCDHARKDHAFYLDLPVLSDQLLLSVFDAQSLKYLLTDNFNNYVLPTCRRQMGQEVFGSGIFQVDGDNWRIQRDIAKTMFTTAARREMIDIFKRDAKALVEILNSHRRSQNPVDIQQLFKRLTLDTFGEIGLGVHLNVLNKPALFSEDFDWTLSELEARFINPIRPFTYNEYYKRLNRMDKYIYEIINQRKMASLEGISSDLLTLVLQPEQDDTFIRDFIMNFIIAGRDTTAALLTWTIYFLTTHPQVLEKAQSEIQQVLGNDEPTFDNIKQLKYITNIFNEVLRLKPPALPITAKEAIKDDILPNGIKVKAGQNVVFSPYVIHRIYWGADSELFKPERWDDPSSKDIYTYIPFLRGPRQCLGMSMAYEEAAVVLCILLQSNVNIKLEPGQSITNPPGLPIIFSCRYGLHVRIV